MKFEVTRSILGLYLDEVSKAVSSKSANYSMIKLLVRNNLLILEATNQELRIRAAINGESLFGSNDGEALVDGRLFLNIVKKTEGKTITLEEADEKIVVKSGKSKFSLNKLSNTFPEQKAQKWDLSFLVKAEVLKNMINKVNVSISSNNSRIVLQGINIKTEDNLLYMYATDGYRGSQDYINLDKLVEGNSNIPEINIIVPGIELSTIVKTFNHSNVKMSLNKYYISFLYGSIQYDIRLIEGEYPKMASLFLTDDAQKIIVNKQGLVASVDRASILLDGAITVLKLDFCQQELKISTLRSQIGQAVEVIEIENPNSLELILGASFKYILDALKTVESNKVILNIFSDVKPFVITSSNPDECLRQVVFPIRLPDGE